MRFAPRGDGGVLGSRNAVGGAFRRICRGEIRRIELIEKLNGGKRVRSEKIQQMRGAANGGGFLGGDAAESKVVQLERKKRRIASANEGFANYLLDGARQSGDGNGIPDLDEDCFGPVGEPVEFGVGVCNGDERVVGFTTVPSWTARMRRGRRPPCLA